MCIGLPRPKHPPKVKYFFQSYSLACSLCSYVCIGLTGPIHPPKVKYFLISCYCSLFCILAFQDKHTLPKWNIFSNLFCCLFSLLVCLYWPYRTNTPSQSEIFSVIVACSLCPCVLAFLYLHTLPKWNIFSNLFCCLFSLLVCLYWPFGASTPSQSEIFSVIVACSLCSCVLAFHCQHTLPKWNILCYCSLFSLLVCIGLSLPAHPPKVKYSLLL